MGMFDAVSRCERINDVDAARVAAFRQDLAKKMAESTEELPFEAILAHEAAITALNQKIVIAEGVARKSGERLAEARAEADQKAAIAKNAEMERAAAAAEKRIRAIANLITKLADELAWLDQQTAEIADYNANERGDLPFIRDTETRVRFLPAIEHTVAPYMEEQWIDANGNRASASLIASGNARKRMVQIGVTHSGSPRREAHMPDSFTTAIRLVDLAGDQIWPPR